MVERGNRGKSNIALALPYTRVSVWLNGTSSGRLVELT
jgi:hypothetical protein